MLTNLLFQTPWWLPTIAIGAGLFVWWTGNQRQEKPVIRAGVAIALAGLILATVSYLVDTPAEKAERRTRQIVASAGSHDWKTFHGLLDRQTAIYGLHGPDEITDAAKRAGDEYAIGSLKITGFNSRQADTLILNTIRVYGEIQGQSFLSDWQLEYEDRGQGLVLREVKANSNQQISEDQIRGRIGRQ
jgi:hypothetical protein